VDHLPSSISPFLQQVHRWYKEEEGLSIEQIADMIITILSDGICRNREGQWIGARSFKPSGC
jgi:hypothetical protein